VKDYTNNEQIPMKSGLDEKGDIIIAKSIKVLNERKAEVERLSKIAMSLQPDQIESLDEALCLMDPGP
jgi:hypothetical protein